MAREFERRMVAAAAHDPMIPRAFGIARLRHETHDTFTLDLAPAEGDAGFAFAPGQFNMLYVFGVGEVPVSISSDPGVSSRLQHTVRVVGAVTRAMCRLRKGDTVGLRGPFGASWPLEEGLDRDLLIVAGGIGLAPLRPVLYRVMALREKYRRITLLYGTRTPEDILYRRELERWRSKFDWDVHVTVDRAGSEWRGNVGVVTTLIRRAALDPSNATSMICGPEVMMRFAVMELQRRGLASSRIFLSMERNMKCAVGFCGHCQYGPAFLCKDGPVFRLDRIEALLGKAEV